MQHKIVVPKLQKGGNNSSILDWPRVCVILLQLVQPEMAPALQLAARLVRCTRRIVPRSTGDASCAVRFPPNLVPNGKDRLVTPKEVLALCREKNVKAVDLRFMDFPGLWQHFTIPVDKLDEDVFEDGLGFDGSSIRGWQAINESDMLVVPQPETASIDPFCTLPTLSMICNIQDPITREDYSRDPRNVARKAVNYLKSTGIGDTCYIGPEIEFFIFDDVRFDQTANAGYYHIDSIEGQWNRGREEKPNLGYKLRYKEGYFPVPPADQMMNIRNEMMQTLIDCGIEHRGPAPRGGHRRPGRDRHEVRQPGRPWPTR